MPRSLVIVESPAKSKTINKILGDRFIVRASMGHVMDLPPRKFGVDPDKNFAAEYKLLTRRKELVKELKKLAQEAPTVYLATDPDREGEAISWHLVQALKLPEGRFKRVVFNEITRSSIEKAFSAPGDISMDRVNAQQVRRIVDRIVGYKLSPLLWEKIARRLSAGRVQSVALKFIVDREREILAFKPEEYWEIDVRLNRNGEPFDARVNSPEVANEAEALALAKELESEKFVVASVSQEEKSEYPFPPFTTSTLQQAASIELGFSAKRTMQVAQRLYEGIDLGRETVGLITYMRTDSVRIAGEAIGAVRGIIRDEFGETYLPERPNFFKSKASAQEAHEAIRPTNVRKTPDSIRAHLTDEQYKLYRLIWKRFVACQMKSALYRITEAQIRAGRATLEAHGREVLFDGFRRLSRATDEPVLPPLAVGDALDVEKITPGRHFTQPPPRYTEAGLIKTLEKHGIGRPSTYAPTLATLTDRGYVRIEKRTLIPTELGILVTEKLERHFETLINAEFTALMEESLDKVEDGTLDGTSILKDFYAEFMRELDKASTEMTSEHGKPSEDKCALCRGPMTVRWTRFGKLTECACGYKKPDAEVPGQSCGRCKSPMSLRWGKRGKFLACTRYPECTFTKSIVRGKVVTVPEDVTCEKSGHPMAIRMSRRGPFLGCTGYPECRNAKKIPKAWLRGAPKPSDGSGAGGGPRTV